MNRVSEIHHIWSEDNFCQPVIAIWAGAMLLGFKNYCIVMQLWQLRNNFIPAKSLFFLMIMQLCCKLIETAKQAFNFLSLQTVTFI